MSKSKINPESLQLNQSKVKAALEAFSAMSDACEALVQAIAKATIALQDFSEIAKEIKLDD